MARAQQAQRTKRIGMLMGLPEGDPEGERWAKAFFQELPRLGWQQGVNVQIDLRWGGVSPEQMQSLAKELVGSKPDLLQVTTTPATAAILRETQSIPVVFSVVSDPIGAGFVESLVRPGGNATGFIKIEASLGGKWVELLKEIVPSTSRVSLLFDPKTSPQTAYYRPSLDAAAAALGVAVTAPSVSERNQIEPVIANLGRETDSGLIVVPDIFTGAREQRDLQAA